MKMTTFKEYFPTANDFQEKITEFVKSRPKEMFEPSNWFIEDIYGVTYKIFKAKSWGKYFIWTNDKIDDESELDVFMEGTYIPLLWSEILNFYKSQIILLGDDLNELKEWKSRGNNYNSLNQSGESRNSQPTPEGTKWDNEKDAPTRKVRSENENNWSNRINDILRVIDNNLNIYFNDIFTKFEKFYIDKFWVDRWIEGE